jgi:hypothetical protein
MIAWITFSRDFGGWSAFTFWAVVISVVLTLGFTVVVFFGGLADLLYLIRAMDESQASHESDDGRVVTAPTEPAGKSEPQTRTEQPEFADS